MGTIPSSFLPPRALWPERVCTLPEHATYPARRNSTEELIDRHVVARGPTGALYWHDPEKQRATVRDGWSRAGDFVTLDADGYVWFMSREDDLIKSSGYRIGPEEVEDALTRHPAVADVGVIGVTDSVRGQRTRAYVTLRPGQAASDALRRELIELCRDEIAGYELPREVAFVPQLPRVPGPAGPGTGKLLRRVLREQAARG